MARFAVLVTVLAGMIDVKGMVRVLDGRDPEAAARLIAEAESGDMDAQYAAGLVYAEGRGVGPDLVQAYYWLTRAYEQGDSDAERLRCLVAAEMQDNEFAEARRLAPIFAKYLREKQRSYPRKLAKMFQSAAGIVPDGRL